MKKLITFTFLIGLAACFEDVSDLKVHIEKVKTQSTGYVQPMPKVPEFDRFDYSSGDLRSPFLPPKAELLVDEIEQMKDCLSPDGNRQKQPLEKYALSDLVMRGTLGENEVIMGLIEAQDASLHRVVVGSYLGLYYGRVTSVSPEQIRILELIPDGAGCWVERETVISMV